MSDFNFNRFEHLEGPGLRLVRLSPEHLPELSKALASPTTWMAVSRGVDTPEKTLRFYTDVILKRQSEGLLLALAVQDKASGKFVAASTFQNAAPDFSRVEIGFTWIADSWQRTFVNTEMKFLMINYAFSVMDVKRVEFAVHPRNEKSNIAMRRIGGVFEGTLRKWRFIPGSDDGDRHIYSIIIDEWAATKARLETMLNRERA